MGLLFLLAPLGYAALFSGLWLTPGPKVSFPILCQGQKIIKDEDGDWGAHWQPPRGKSPALQPAGHAGFPSEIRSINWQVLWSAGVLDKLECECVYVCVCSKCLCVPIPPCVGKVGRRADRECSRARPLSPLEHQAGWTPAGRWATPGWAPSEEGLSVS